MESLGIIIFTIIVLIIIVSIIRTSSSQKNIKNVEKRTGIAKLSLMVNKDSIYLGNQFKKRGNNDSSWFSVNLSVIKIHQTLSSGFYNLLEETSKTFGNKELFDGLANETSLDNSKRLGVSSMMFGLSFGVLIKRIADAINAEIKKPMIKKFINSCDFNEAHKKDIIKMVTAYINLETIDTKAKWESLEKITYALMGAKIKRDKNDIADPIMIKPLKISLGHAYDKAPVNDSIITQLEEQGLIKTNKNSRNSLVEKKQRRLRWHLIQSYNNSRKQ